MLDTLIAHKDSCVGIVANMIGVRKRIVVFDNDGTYTIMFNPETIKKTGPYDTEEDCLSMYEPLENANAIRQSKYNSKPLNSKPASEPSTTVWHRSFITKWIIVTEF